MASIRYNNATTDNHSADVLVFGIDPTQSSPVTIVPTFTLAGIQSQHGITVPWNEARTHFAISDGAGGLATLSDGSTFKTYELVNGTTIRQVGNATDGYTFLQS